MNLHAKFQNVFPDIDPQAVVAPNLISLLPRTSETQEQTRQAFSNKWDQYTYDTPDFRKLITHQKNWYLALYGFSCEDALANYLKKCTIILDAGSGLCYKSAWFAELSPSSLVVAADISDSLLKAAEYYKGLQNLIFIQCDIADMGFFKDGSFDYVSCDQVIHHTADPFKTFKELVRVTKLERELSVYVYRKKALPRELLDDYFREFSKTLDHDTLMNLSRQITELGRLLSSVDADIDFPNIPLLGIEGGIMPVQRFIYWNFLKCFWNEELGYENSLMTNYDWYAPSQASRYSEQEFKNWFKECHLKEIHFHKELACLSSRLLKTATPLPGQL